MRYFNYDEIARKAKIPSAKLGLLQKAIRQEFPRDDMMYELHLLRVCLAIQDGHITADEAIQSEQAA